MFEEGIDIAFRSVRLYDHSTKSVGKSDEVKRYVRLEATHSIQNQRGEVWDVIASPEQLNQLKQKGYSVLGENNVQT